MPKIRLKAVDRLLHRGQFEFKLPIPLFYRPVVFEKADVIRRGFDPQDQTEFVVHLDAGRPHVVFDPKNGSCGSNWHDRKRENLLSNNDLEQFFLGMHLTPVTMILWVWGLSPLENVIEFHQGGDHRVEP